MWCRSVGQARPIEDIPPTELNKLLLQHIHIAEHDLLKASMVAPMYGVIFSRISSLKLRNEMAVATVWVCGHAGSG